MPDPITSRIEEVERALAGERARVSAIKARSSPKRWNKMRAGATKRIYKLMERRATLQWMQAFPDAGYLYDVKVVGFAGEPEFYRPPRVSAEEFDAIRDLNEMYRDLLLSPDVQGQDIVVPPNSVFIEALPGSHALLEDFKLAHRAIDVKKAQAGARSEKIENRKAYRLPEIEKVIAVGKGASLGVVTDDD